MASIEAQVERYLAMLPPESQAQGRVYTESGYWLAVTLPACIALAAWLLTASRTTPRLRSSLETRLPRCVADFFAAAALTAFLLLACSPLVMFAGYWRPKLMTPFEETAGQWLLARLVWLPVVAAAGGVAGAALCAAARRWPQRWPLAAIAVLLPLNAVWTIAAPLVDTRNMSVLDAGNDKSLAAVAALLEEFDVPPPAVRIADTEILTAHAAGIGPWRRIVIARPLLDRSRVSRAELLAVVAHELGHYRYRHGLRTLAVESLAIFFGCLLVGWLYSRLIQTWGARYGLQSPADSASLPWLTAILAGLMLLSLPVVNTFTRQKERAADAFGLNAARQGDAWAQFVVKLGRYRKMEPAAWEEFIFFDHPSGRRRIEQAMRWKARYGERPGDSPAPAAGPAP